jgi:hypothetical protein
MCILSSLGPISLRHAPPAVSSLSPSLYRWWGITRESKRATALFILFSFVQPTWVAYKLWFLEENPSKLPTQVTYAQFAVVGGVWLLVRGALVVYSWRCMQSFGKGLRQHVFLVRVNVRQGQGVLEALGVAGSGGGGVQVVNVHGSGRQGTGLDEALLP